MIVCTTFHYLTYIWIVCLILCTYIHMCVSDCFFPFSSLLSWYLTPIRADHIYHHGNVYVCETTYSHMNDTPWHCAEEDATRRRYNGFFSFHFFLSSRSSFVSSHQLYSRRRRRHSFTHHAGVHIETIRSHTVSFFGIDFSYKLVWFNSKFNESNMEKMIWTREQFHGKRRIENWSCGA